MTTLPATIVDVLETRLTRIHERLEAIYIAMLEEDNSQADAVADCLDLLTGWHGLDQKGPA